MKPKRRLLRSLLICGLALILTLSAALIVSAHPGGTDAQGGHHVGNTGQYHYHHGYSAHSHEDMDGDGTLDCPYSFDDQTHHSYKDSSSSASGYSSFSKFTVQNSRDEESKEITKPKSTSVPRTKSYLFFGHDHTFTEIIEILFIALIPALASGAFLNYFINDTLIEALFWNSPNSKIISRCSFCIITLFCYIVFLNHFS